MIEVNKVLFYSGGERDEVPKIIYTNSGLIRVYKIIEKRLEEDYQTGKRKKVFIFKSIGGNIYHLESTEGKYKLNKIKKY